MLAKHGDKLITGEVRETFADRFGCTVAGLIFADFAEMAHSIQWLDADADHDDLAKLHDLFPALDSLAFLATHQAVAGFQITPSETAGDVLGFVQKLRCR